MKEWEGKVMLIPRDPYDILRSIAKGTEVNIHTKEKTYYNVRFQKYMQTLDMAVIEYDLFYENKEDNVTYIPCSKIISIDLPKVLDKDYEDEE